MAKSRAQRKAEQRRRQATGEPAAQSRATESRAQHDTQVPESADVLEAELAEQGANLDELTAKPPSGNGAADATAPPAPAPARGADKITRREQKRAERERRAKAKESEQRRRPREEPVERKRGRVIAFFISCWAELKRVQWPDRETLIQASGVTVVFIAILGTYLGALDAIFDKVVKAIL